MGNYAGLTLEGDFDGSLLGRIVSRIGDFNGDGFDDFLVTQSQGQIGDSSDYYYAGATFVVFGSRSGPATLDVRELDGTNGFAVIGGDYTLDPVTGFYNAFGNFSQYATGLGDFNGDGLADIAVAANSSYGPTGAYSYAGESFAQPSFIYVIFGTGAVQGPVMRINELEQGDFAAIGGLSGKVTSIAAAGDVNGDGLADMILNQDESALQQSAYSRASGDRPALGYVVFGDADADAVDVRNLGGSAGFSVLGQQLTGDLRQDGEITSIGDINGDGIGDLMVRSSRLTVVERYDPTPWDPNNGDTSATLLTMTDIDRTAGVLLGQGPGDGFSPQLVINPDPNIYYGPTSLINLDWMGGTSNIVGIVTSDDAWNNHQIVGVGDVNGDGYDDVAWTFNNLIGVGSGSGSFEPVNGAVYIMFGGPEGVDTDAFFNDTADGLPMNFGLLPGEGADVVLYDSTGSASFGKVVAAAGDVNGDGYGDFLISDTLSRGYGDEGSVFLVFGGTFAGQNLAGAGIDLSPAAGGLDGIGYRFVGARLDQEKTLGGTSVPDRQWLSAAGDINGDGYDDLLIGAPEDLRINDYGYVEQSGGHAFVVYGGPSALESADDADGANDNIIALDNLTVEAPPEFGSTFAGLTIEGDASSYSQLGRIVSGIGDFNGDGIGDFLVSQPYGNVGDNYEQTDYGGIYVVFGTRNGPATLNVGDLDGTNGFAIVDGDILSDPVTGFSTSWSNLGRIAAGVGDFNGDGLADIAVAARSYYAATYSPSYSGVNFATPNFIYVIFGTEEPQDALMRLSDLAEGDFQAIGGLSGQILNLEAGGDINGDGRDDLILMQDERYLRPSSYSSYSRSVGDRPVLGYVVFGETQPDGAANPIDVRDLDGTDGFAVLGMQIPDANYYGGFYGEGGYYGDVYRQDAEIVSLGDIDGDGLDDVLIRTMRTWHTTEENTITTDPTPDEPDSGDEYTNTYTTTTFHVDIRAEVLLGSRAAIEQDSTVTAGEYYSDDLIQLSWSNVSGSYSSTGYFSDPQWIWRDHDIAGIGDVNGDGYDDMAFSFANLYSSGGFTVNNGAVYVLFGGPGGIDTSSWDDDDTGIPQWFGLQPGEGADLVLYDSTAASTFGRVIKSAGDVNGDGYDDFLIADSAWRSNTDYGSVYLIFGGAFEGQDQAGSGIDLSPDAGGLEGIGYRFVGAVLDTTYNLGNSPISDRRWVASAGDVNGDGFADIIIGSPFDRDDSTYYWGSQNGGRVFVIYGGPDGLETADDADGANDNVIHLDNLVVDVETGLRPIEVSLRGAGEISVVRGEGQNGATVFAFDVVRTGNLNAEVSFDYNVTVSGLSPAADASDFVGGVLPSGTVSFAAGSAIARVEIEVQGDLLIEQAELFQFNIFNLSLPAGATGGFTGDLFSYGQIANDDFPITVTVSGTSVTEGSGDLSFVVNRSGDTQSQATVSYLLQSDSFRPATGEDFVNGLVQTGTINFAAGETSKVVSFGVVNDNLIEENERVRFELTEITSTNPNAVFDLQTNAVIGTIINDDFPVILRATGRYQDEDSGQDLIFTITRSGNTTVGVEVFYEFSPYLPASLNAADFVNGFPPNGSHYFAPGETSVTLSFPVVADDIVEADEYIEMRLTGATAADGVVIDRQTSVIYSGLYNDDFNIELSVLGASGRENDGPITVTIRRSGEINAAVEVDYEVFFDAVANSADAADITNILPMSGTFTFAPGERDKFITITPVGDTAIEPNEFVAVRLTDARTTSGVNIVRQEAPTYVQITNDDFPVEITVTGQSRAEDAGPLTATITRSGRTDVEVTVHYTLADYVAGGEGPSVEPDDIEGVLPRTGSVTFAIGEVSKSVSITPVADANIEPNEFVQITLTGAELSGTSVGSDAVLNVQNTPASLQIINDDFPITLTPGNAFATEGGNLVFTVNRSGETDAEISVNWALRNYPFGNNITGPDLVGGLAQSGTVNFASGETSKQVIIGTIDDTIVEGTEYVEFILTGHSTTSTVPVDRANWPSYGHLTDNDFNIVLRASWAFANEDSGQLTFLIHRSGELGADATVNYSFTSAGFSSATSDDIVGGLPQTGSVTFAANETVKSVTLGVVADTVVEGNEYVEFRLTSASTTSDKGIDLPGSPSYGVIYNDDFNIDLRVQAISASEGDTLSFLLTRSGDLNSAVTVSYSINPATFGDPVDADDLVLELPQAGAVTFLAGQTSKVITLQSTEDDVEENNEGVTLTITNATTPSDRTITGIGTSGTAFVLNDDFPVEFRASSAWGNEDAGPLNFTVTRSGNVNVAATVSYSFTSYAGGNGATSDDIVGGLPRTGVLNFAAGETSKMLSITPVADTVIEATEIVQLDLTGATVADSSRIVLPTSPSLGYIYNDDFPARITVSGGRSLTEGGSGQLTPVTFTFTRDGNRLDATTVTYNLEPVGTSPANSNDIDSFLPGFGRTVTFAAGEVTKTVVVNIVGDGIIEQHETFQLRVTGISSSNGTSYDLVGGVQQVTILNDDGRPPVLPPGIDVRGFIFGDPHIVTLDGLTYSFMAVGEFVMLETLPGATDPFQIQARFEPAEGSSLVSLTTRLAVEVSGQRIEFVAEGDHLLIDGVATEIDPDLGGIDIDGDELPDVFLTTDGGRTIFTVVLNDLGEQMAVEVMEGYLNISLALDESRAGNVRGLMGNGDGQTGNDLALRDGTELAQPVPFDQLYGDFAADWRIGGTEAPSLFTYAEGESTETFTDLSFPVGVIDLATVPQSIRDAAEAAADAAGITDPILREAAILDYIFTGNPSFLTGAAGVGAENTEGLEIEDSPEIPLSVGVAKQVTTVTEGDSGTVDVSFTIYRTGPTDEPVTVSYALGGVDAADLAEGTAFSGIVLLDIGQSEATLTVSVKGDLETEPDETLVVSLTGTTAGVIAAASAQTTILTDDFPPIAEDDSFNAGPDGTLSDSLFGANGTAEGDRDPDGDTISVVAVNGTPLNGVPLAVILAYGSATISPTGTISYATDARASALAEGEVGTESFTYQISDGQGGFDTATVNIAVQGAPAPEDLPPLAVSDPVAEVLEGRSIDILFADLLSNDSDAEDGTPTLVSVNFDGVTGAGTTEGIAGGVRFTAVAPFVGEVTYEYTVQDSLGQMATATNTIRVLDDLDPLAVSDPVAEVLEGRSIDILFADLLSNDSDAEDGTPTLVSVNFDGVTGAGTTEGIAGGVRFTAVAPFVGEVTYEYTVQDSLGQMATATNTIRVLDDADPVAQDDTDFSVLEGDQIVISFADLLANDSDAEDGPVTIVPGGFTFSGPYADAFAVVGDTVVFTSSVGGVGSESFTYTVQDSLGQTDTATVSITVEDDLPPEAVDDEGFTVREGQQLVISFAELLANDSDFEDGRPVIDPTGFNFDGPFGDAFRIERDTVVFSPGRGASGPVSFTYKAVDSLGQFNFATVAISVVPQGNGTPVAVGDSYSTGFGDALSVSAALGLLANDSDPDGDDLEVVAFGSAANGSVTVSTDGSFTYTPNAGFSGIESILYTISDGFAVSTATLMIEVAANGTPVAVGDSYSTGFGDALSVSAALGLLANDSDPDGDDLEVVAFGSAANGSVTVSTDGSFTYTPNAGFSGIESILYTISDGFAVSTATLMIEVERDGFDFNLIAATPNQKFLRGTDEADALVFNTSRSTQAFGGEGADVFVFLKSGDGKRDTGYIRDFEQGVDLIDVGDAAFTMRVVGTDTVIRFSASDRDTLFVSDVALTAADFTTEWSSRDAGLIA